MQNGISKTWNWGAGTIQKFRMAYSRVFGSEHIHQVVFWVNIVNTLIKYNVSFKYCNPKSTQNRKTHYPQNPNKTQSFSLYFLWKPHGLIPIALVCTVFQCSLFKYPMGTLQSVFILIRTLLPIEEFEIIILELN